MIDSIERFLVSQVACGMEVNMFFSIFSSFFKAKKAKKFLFFVSLGH